MNTSTQDRKRNHFSNLCKPAKFHIVLGICYQSVEDVSERNTASLFWVEMCLVRTEMRYTGRFANMISIQTTGGGKQIDSCPD